MASGTAGPARDTEHLTVHSRWHRQTGSHTMHEQFLLPTMPDNDMHCNSPLLLCESAQNPSSHYIPPPNLLCPHLLSLLLPLLHLKTLLSQAQSLPKVHHLPPLLLHYLLQLSDVVLKESDLSILVMDLTVSPAVREIQTAGCWREENGGMHNHTQGYRTTGVSALECSPSTPSLPHPPLTLLSTPSLPPPPLTPSSIPPFLLHPSPLHPLPLSLLYPSPLFHTLSPSSTPHLSSTPSLPSPPLTSPTPSLPSPPLTSPTPSLPPPPLTSLPHLLSLLHPHLSSTPSLPLSPLTSLPHLLSLLHPHLSSTPSLPPPPLTSLQ